MPADVSNFVKTLSQKRQRALEAAKNGVDAFGEHVIGDAQQLTPVDTGALQASGTTLPAEMEGEKVLKVIGFNTSYAAAVHEKLNAKHAVGQAKFLETALRQNERKFSPFMAERVKKALEDGTVEGAGEKHGGAAPEGHGHK